MSRATDSTLADRRFDEDAIQALGRRLGERPARLRNGKRRAYERAMSMVAGDAELRAALFRLVDVAPACAGNAEMTEHLAAYLEDANSSSLPVTWGARAAGAPALGRVAGRISATMVRQMAGRFIVGESIADALPTLGRLWEEGVATTVDLLGEATVTAAEGQAYADRCDEALRTLAAATAGWPDRPLLESDSEGRLSPVNLSVKVTALTASLRPEAPDRGRAEAADHLRRLLRRAAEVGAHLHIDMESMDSRELVLALVLDLLDEPEFAAAPSVGLVLQAYLRDSEEIFESVLARAESAGRETPLTIRLVKGAYWDHETIEAAQHGWPVPVWTEKVESDRCFERLSRRMVDSFPLIRPAFATHNLRSVAHAVTYAESAGLERRDVEVQVLRGLGDDLQDAAAAAGLRCRTYCPVGDMVAGMAYLVRRLLENTSNASFLASKAGGSDLDELLRQP